MKKILGTLLLLSSLNAFAQPVYLYPTCRSVGNDGECTITNTSGKDITCNMQITGFTRSGKYVSAMDFNRYLYPGMMAWVRVYNSNFNDPITSLNATANCSTR